MPNTSLPSLRNNLGTGARPVLYSPGVRVEPVVVPPALGPTLATPVGAATPFGSALDDARAPDPSSACISRSNVARISREGTHCPMKFATFIFPASANAAETAIDPRASPTSSEGETRRI